ncbi:MAG: hypothetical protein IJ733_18195 [Lachnospiraceae bacterium]|nr:hypothetical protein [Lachnospiraceae bacterium]
MAMMDWENYGRDRYGRSEGDSSTYGYQNHSYAKRDYGSYVYGNTVRKVQSVPFVQNEPGANTVPDRRREIRPERRERQYQERKPVKLPGISGRAFLFLSTMLTSVVVLGFTYLSAKNTVAKQKSEIVSLQSEIAEMKEQNDEMNQNIINSVNLADIYKIATEKLKMVHAGKNQIYTYSNKKSNMVKQYANIPGADD